jgi:hypothetical protein
MQIKVKMKYHFIPTRMAKTESSKLWELGVVDGNPSTWEGRLRVWGQPGLHSGPYLKKQAPTTKNKSTSVGKDVEILQLSNTASRNVKQCICLEKKQSDRPGMVVHAYNPSTWEAEAAVSQVWDQPEIKKESGRSSKS